ncbi:MAG TPA: SUMF1/EgtB/PvdO family nonheme iron enzyme, partial [Thermotogota bacterium]|nr:SUMF1/EgtB/PvdO family nonheme iron enzyme [Thermotogota bacterium]
MKGKLLVLWMVMLVGCVFAKDFAIVVGIDNYRWLGTLKYAEKDAIEVGDQLRKMGFNTQILTGKVSGEEILGEIQYMSQYTRSTDTLLFYFSGHGAPGDTESTRGLCTYYSDPKTGSFVLTQDQLKRELANFGGKTVVVLDACYQGSDRRNLQRDNAAMDRKLGEEVDLLVTSSAANQEANDGFYIGGNFIANGVVGYYLQQALKGEADRNQDGMLTAGELSGYFLGYASYMAEQNEQDLQVEYRNRNEGLIPVGETSVGVPTPVVSAPAVPSSPSTRIPQGMVLVEGESFQMGNTRGDSEGDDDEKPVHEVELTYDYLIGKYEVTFGEYDAYCAATGASKPDDEGWGRGSRPVINVSWNDAIGYCNWLSEKEGL